VRLILDGTVVRVRLDRKATSISLLVVIGVRADGQKMLLAIKSMGGESTEAWPAVLDDLIKRGLRQRSVWFAGYSQKCRTAPRDHCDCMIGRSLDNVAPFEIIETKKPRPFSHAGARRRV
jgi:hypothetical protein